VLYLVSLTKQLIPDNIWRPEGYTKTKIKDGVIKGARLPKDENDEASGFTGIKNISKDFKQYFPEIYPNAGD
jgi:hypothetical protein